MKSSFMWLKFCINYLHFVESIYQCCTEFSCHSCETSKILIWVASVGCYCSIQNVRHCIDHSIQKLVVTLYQSYHTLQCMYRCDAQLYNVYVLAWLTWMMNWFNFLPFVSLVLFLRLGSSPGEGEGGLCGLWCSQCPHACSRWQRLPLGLGQWSTWQAWQGRRNRLLWAHQGGHVSRGDCPSWVWYPVLCFAHEGRQSTYLVSA